MSVDDDLDGTLTPDNIPDVSYDHVAAPLSGTILDHMSEKDILDLISTVPKLTKTCLDLQGNLVSLKNEFSMYRLKCERRFNAIEQYSRRNSILLEYLRNVPRGARSTKFSKYVVRELNKLFPHLRIRPADIDAAHVLYYTDVEKRCPVVIVKFVSRDLRNTLYYSRKRISHTGVVIREHFTPSNQQLLEDASISDMASEVWSDQCKIFARINGKKKLLVDETDLITPASCANDPDITDAIGNPPLNVDIAEETPPVVGNAPADVSTTPPTSGSSVINEAISSQPPVNVGIIKVIEAKAQSNKLNKRYANNNRTNKPGTNSFRKNKFKKTQNSKFFYSKNFSNSKQQTSFINSNHSSFNSNYAQTAAPSQDSKAYRGGYSNAMNYRSSAYPGAGSSKSVYHDPQRWFPPVFYGNHHDAGGPYYYYDNVQSSNMPSAVY